MATVIKQGDAYALPVGIKLNGKGIAAADIDTVEFYIGDSVRKLYPRDATYNEQDGFFYVPIDQNESFSLPQDDIVAIDVRVKFVGGMVKGVQKKEYITVVDATSEVVL